MPDTGHGARITIPPPLDDGPRPLVFQSVASFVSMRYNRPWNEPRRKAFAVEVHMAFRRITIDPEKMAGVPCIRDLRMPVATVVAMVAEGMTEDEILEAHPDLEPEDIREALRYAAEAVKERALPLKSA